MTLVRQSQNLRARISARPSRAGTPTPGHTAEAHLTRVSRPLPPLKVHELKGGLSHENSLSTLVPPPPIVPDLSYPAEMSIQDEINRHVASHRVRPPVAPRNGTPREDVESSKDSLSLLLPPANDANGRSESITPSVRLPFGPRLAY